MSSSECAALAIRTPRLCISHLKAFVSVTADSRDVFPLAELYVHQQKSFTAEEMRQYINSIMSIAGDIIYKVDASA